MASSNLFRGIKGFVETSSSLRVFWVCGLAGILVDLDHLISLFLWRYINNQINEGRIWHTPLFILTCSLICYLLSSVRGLHAKLVLAGIVAVTTLVLVYSPWVIWRITE